MALHRSHGRAMLARVVSASCPAIVYRTIDLERDADVAYANYRDAGLASFRGDGSRISSREVYLHWLRSRIEEFPDGHVLAHLGERCVGQLELQVPYGMNVGYVNLYCVTPAFRGLGFGRLLHEYAERYFRSWEAERIELDVAPSNERAVKFYRRMGYHFVGSQGRLWRMHRDLRVPHNMGRVGE
ncbi:MAG: GNAT family N-acetyltransferase [Tepidisphaeraceae bacterium]